MRVPNYSDVGCRSTGAPTLGLAGLSGTRIADWAQHTGRGRSPSRHRPRPLDERSVPAFLSVHHTAVGIGAHSTDDTLWEERGQPCVFRRTACGREVNNSGLSTWTQPTTQSQVSSRIRPGPEFPIDTAPARVGGHDVRHAPTAPPARRRHQRRRCLRQPSGIPPRRPLGRHVHGLLHRWVDRRRRHVGAAVEPDRHRRSRPAPSARRRDRRRSRNHQRRGLRGTQEARTAHRHRHPERRARLRQRDLRLRCRIHHHHRDGCA